MKHLILICTLLISSIVASQTLSSAEASEFKKKVVAKNKSIQTMQATFQQKKHLDFMSKDIETFGEMAFSKPDHLNWQYNKPYKYRVVFNKDHITINDEGNVSQLKADNKVFKRINNLIVSSVSGDIFSGKEFAITLSKAGNKVLAKLIPKDKTLLKYMSEIHLYLASDYTVDTVKLIEPSKDYTEIIFTNKRLNTPINDNIFKM